MKRNRRKRRVIVRNKIRRKGLKPRPLHILIQQLEALSEEKQRQVFEYIFLDGKIQDIHLKVIAKLTTEMLLLPSTYHIFVHNKDDRTTVIKHFDQKNFTSKVLSILPII